MNSSIVEFIYTTIPGRLFLKLIQILRLDKIAVWFLCSSFSRSVIPRYIKKNHICMEEFTNQKYHTFQEFFLREKKDHTFDPTAEHLISPCDGWLSLYPIEVNKGFELKGSYYKVDDLIKDRQTAKKFMGGQCLVFRLCAADYHHYCYIDNGTISKNQYIEGQLHSVQPVACEKYPVFSLNRREWTLMETENFGTVVQTEIGALVVGGIVNYMTEGQFYKGEEKGRFELSGSTIVVFFEKGKIEIRKEILDILKNKPETRVTLGMWIGNKK